MSQSKLAVNFADQLQDAIERTQTPALVGIDPHLALLPDEFARAREADVDPEERAELVGRFITDILDVCAGRVPAVKPQSAFYEMLGAPGAKLWEDTVRAAHERDLVVIGDVKRGDIASTAAAYATAFLEGLPGTDPDTLCDAVTINPFLGAESIDPFLEVCDRTGRGIYVLVRTSNPGRAQFQTHGEPELSVKIAEAVRAWGAERVGASGLSSVGAVVGATNKDELATYRDLMPQTPLLLPGYGAQGATAADIAGAFHAPAEGSSTPRGAIVNSSRGILFAWRSQQHSGKSWKDASADALSAMIDDLGCLSR